MYAFKVIGNYIPLLTPYGFVYTVHLTEGLDLWLFDSFDLSLSRCEIVKIKYDLEKTDKCCFRRLFNYPYHEWPECIFRLFSLDSDYFDIPSNPEADFNSLFNYFRKALMKDEESFYMEDRCVLYHKLKNTPLSSAFLNPTPEQESFFSYFFNKTYVNFKNLISALDFILVLNRYSPPRCYWDILYLEMEVLLSNLSPEAFKRRFHILKEKPLIVKAKKIDQYCHRRSIEMLSSIIIVKSSKQNLLPIIGGYIFKLP